MDTDAKIDVLKSFAEEIITEDDLKSIFEGNDHPIAYDGFEPSGVAPIHFGLLRARNVKKMLSIGIKPKLYLADYFAFINNKFDGDLDKIRMAGEYFVEVWKACGIDTKKVEVIWAKDLMDNLDYWDRFMKVGKATTLERIKRAITIMGRKEGESLSAAQLFYPAMQVTDIFQMDVDICQLGMDQRRANILGREIAEKYKWKSPAVVHHPLVLGLQGMPSESSGGFAGFSYKSAHEKAAKDSEIDKLREPAIDKVSKASGIDELRKPVIDKLIEYKMSKSNPKSALYMHDSYSEIKDKIKSAYCPEKIVDGNPLFNYIRLIILKDPKETITIERPQKFGGNLESDGYEKLVQSYKKGELHPMDLKTYVAERLEEQIKPVREHFEKDKHAKELYETVKSYKITR